MPFPTGFPGQGQFPQQPGFAFPGQRPAGFPGQAAPFPGAPQGMPPQGMPQGMPPQGLPQGLPQGHPFAGFGGGMPPGVMPPPGVAGGFPGGGQSMQNIPPDVLARLQAMRAQGGGGMPQPMQRPGGGYPQPMPPRGMEQQRTPWLGGFYPMGRPQGQ